MAGAIAESKSPETGLVRGLGLFDSTMVAGSMIGSGIFIVSAEIARQVGAPGWLLVVWIITGVLTIFGALSYGELAGMMPNAGGQYVYCAKPSRPCGAFFTAGRFSWSFRPARSRPSASALPATSGCSGRSHFRKHNFIINPMHLARRNTPSPFRRHSSWASCSLSF